MQLSRQFSELAQEDVRLSHPAVWINSEQKFGRSLQYHKDGNTYLAVEGLFPYGHRTHELFTDRLEQNPEDLLGLANFGDDYSVFDVPTDLLSVPAVSLGNGPKISEDLEDVYRRLGELIGYNAKFYTMQKVGISVLGLLRESGKIVFIPPYPFRLGPANENSIKRSLGHSIATILRPVISENSANILMYRALEGFDDARSKS